MSKRVALKDRIEVDNVEIGNYCRAVSFSSEHENVDVSGFTDSGADESLAGKTVQSVTIEVFGSYGSGQIHQTIYPLHRDRSVFGFKWRPDRTASVSSTNPELRGNVQALTYSPGATRGEVETFQVTMTAADSDGLEFFYT